MGLFQSSEAENEGLCIYCIILLHYTEQLDLNNPSFSYVLSQAVIWPGQDLAGKAEKG